MTQVSTTDHLRLAMALPIVRAGAAEDKVALTAFLMHQPPEELLLTAAALAAIAGGLVRELAAARGKTPEQLMDEMEKTSARMSGLSPDRPSRG